MTVEELQRLLGNVERPKRKPMDDERRDFAKSLVDQFEETVQLQEQALRSLGTYLEDFTLPQALIGAIGVSVTEIRSQLPALREAVKEAGK